MGSTLSAYWHSNDINSRLIIQFIILLIITLISYKIVFLLIFFYFTYKFLANKPKICDDLLDIEEFVKNEIWTRDYLIEYVGVVFYARCTILKLSNNKYCVHSPSPIDDKFELFFSNKEIEYIIAPGNYHYFHIVKWHKKYPNAKILICPGVEYKAKDLDSSSIYGILHDNYIDHDINCVFHKDFEISLIRGFYEINEIVLLHKKTSTLIVVDVIEYITDNYYDKFNRFGHLWWYLLRMHNSGYPAPEYQMTLKHNNLAKQGFNKILSWKFNKIIISHGENIYPKKTNKNINDKQAITYCTTFCQKSWQKYLQ